MAEVVVDGARVLLRDGVDELALPALWLRQYSAEPSELDGITGQRLFDPHLLPVDLAITSAGVDGGVLTVTFSDGHTSTYAEERVAALRRLDDGVPAPVAWRAGDGIPAVHPWTALDDPGSELAVLHDFLVHGTVVLDGLPTEPGTILTAARRLGFVRETNFGALFDVRSVPDSTDLAYRAVPLSAHTDNPYRVPVPGIQLLHCLVNETSGGLSSLVDGLAAAARKHGVTFSAQAVGGMFGVYFSAVPPTSYAEVMACDKEAFNRFFHAMLAAGHYFAPSAYEAGFVSAAHSDADIAKTVAAAERWFASNA